MCKRIISLLLVLVTLFSVLIVPASATAGDAVDYVIDNFWGPFSFDKLKGLVKSFLADDKTPETATESDWQAAYDRYVRSVRDEYGSTILNSSGVLISLVPDFSPVDNSTFSAVYSNYSYNSKFASFDVEIMYKKSGQAYLYANLSCMPTGAGTLQYLFRDDDIPKDGNVNLDGAYYTCLSDKRIYDAYLQTYYDAFNSSGGKITRLNLAGSHYFSADDGLAHIGAWDPDTRVGAPAFIAYSSSAKTVNMHVVVPLQCLLWMPDNFSAPVSESRPGSLTGITYGYQNDTGEIIVYVAKDSGMFNEEGGYLYNPITGKTLQADSWYYDYENRRYDIALANNQGRATLEYGDDGARITIIDSGNVTNVYNYYYMTPKDEPVDPPPVDPTPTPTPKPCTHSYTSAVTELPTCLIPGVRSYICMLCGDTYTEPVAATGHIWVVRETVNASYDDNGNLLQAGYTIYKCSKCGTEHKDTADVGPPGNGSGGGGGGSGGFPGDTNLPDIPGSSEDEDGFNIFDIVGSIVNALWSLISGLFSTIFGGVVGFFTSLGSGISGFFSAFSGQDGVFGFATYGGADIWD